MGIRWIISSLIEKTPKTTRNHLARSALPPPQLPPPAAAITHNVSVRSRGERLNDAVKQLSDSFFVLLKRNDSWK